MGLKGIRSLKKSNRRRKEKNPFAHFTSFHVTPEPGFVKPKDLSAKLKKLMLIEES